MVIQDDDPYIGVDIDGCRNAETGQIADWALEIIEAAATYTEVSPSLTGVKLWATGHIPHRSYSKKFNPGSKPGIEIYAGGRWFTVTGWHVEGTPRTINRRTSQLTKLAKKEFPGKFQVYEAQAESPGSKLHYKAKDFILETWLEEHGVPITGEASDNQGRKWKLAECPRSDRHSTPDPSGAYVGQMNGAGTPHGAIYARCSHAGCYGGDLDLWHDLRRKFEPGWEPYRPINVDFGRNGGGVQVSINGRRIDNPKYFNLTDLGNAERLIAQHGRDVRYCFLWAKWLVWTGSRWERDDSGRVHRLAKEVVRGIYGEAAAAEDDSERKALAKHAASSEAKNRIEAMLELAKSDVPVSPDDLDANPWLLNAPNGTVNLKTGEIQPHRREDLITKMAGAEYRPDAPSPVWDTFLKRVLPGDELRAFVQGGTGYSATGDTSEQCLFINHGAGANGKSTFQEAIAASLGDYATRTPTEMLLAKRAGGIPNDVARLKGARFVAASETEQGRHLAESLVKDLTGQDTISARFMRAEWFDFKPTHKLWLSTNHKPEIRGTDNAIWRRIRLIPWAVTIPPAERDHKLSEKLREELPGILAWAVHGCLEWRSNGLRAPDEVRRATSAYRAEMDILAAFLTEECTTGVAVNAAAGALYGQYKEWCAETGEKAESQRKFGERLKERGFERRRITSGLNKGKFEYLGVGLLEDGLKVTRGGEPLGEKTGGGEPLQSERFTEENPKDKGNPPNTHSSGEWSEPKNDINASK